MTLRVADAAVTLTHRSGQPGGAGSLISSIPGLVGSCFLGWFLSEQWSYPGKGHETF